MKFSLLKHIIAGLSLVLLLNCSHMNATVDINKVNKETIALLQTPERVHLQKKFKALLANMKATFTQLSSKEDKTLWRDIIALISKHTREYAEIIVTLKNDPSIMNNTPERATIAKMEEIYRDLMALITTLSAHICDANPNTATAYKKATELGLEIASKYGHLKLKGVPDPSLGAKYVILRSKLQNQV